MGKWEMISFDQVLTIVNGKNQKKVENSDGIYPIYGSGGVMGYADDYLCEANTVVIGRKVRLISQSMSASDFGMLTPHLV